MKHRTALATLVLLTAGLTASTLLAGEPAGFTYAGPPPFKPLSPSHTIYGVSQFLAGNIPGFAQDGSEERPQVGGFPLRLWNPTPVTQRAVVFVYERGRLVTAYKQDGDFYVEGDPEEFEGCFHLQLTPHGSLAIGADVFSEIAGQEPFYVEVISVPEQRIATIPGITAARLGDGLGLRSSTGGGTGSQVQPVHPTLFSLPHDTDNEVRGLFDEAEQQAIRCMCEAAEEVGDRRLWEAFRVFCY